MKKIFLISLILFFLASCAREVDLSTGTAPPTDPLSEDSALEGAIGRMHEFLDELYGPGTRSQSGRQIASVKRALPAATRNGGEDPLTYIVSFDGGGYVVLSTDPDSEELLAFAEAGWLDPEDFGRAYNKVEQKYLFGYEVPPRGEGDPVEIDEDSLWDAPEDFLYGDEHLPMNPLTPAPFPQPGYGGGDDDGPGRPPYTLHPEEELSPAVYLLAEYVYLCSIKEPGFDPETDPGHHEDPDLEPQYGPWTSTAGVPPLIRTKWGQWAPFNNDCPIATFSDGRRDRAPAGCVAIAAGQIAAYYRRPVSENWEAISNFRTWSIANNNFTEPAAHQPIIASYIRRLGNELCMIYGAKQSGTLSSKAATYLRNKVDLENVCRHWYSWERVEKRLRYGCPVYMHGTSHKIFDAHAWIIDGYIMEERRCEGQATQRRKLLHVNWGWGGLSDGYYVEGMFKPYLGASQIEPGIGDGGGPAPGSNFTIFLQVFTWKKSNIN